MKGFAVFKNREFRIRVVKATPYENAKAIADAVLPDPDLDVDHIAETVKDVVFYSAITVTAAVVCSTAAVTTGRITFLVAQKLLK